ncbi:unnamed protein product [Bemisia tabaci]|uniref:Mediator of RNA polymerase II transcription subunit 27 n=1 Tax=Bemisia tabaci TaxID=7038 RepID=A0A9P0AFG1_BEMTA|nr:PREDICTED: mediator of RNA polymerase II transcription subunit 27-like [Bemisia tabaci]CAH0390601.1 unnamed protein product [Bemisia tabaci]
MSGMAMVVPTEPLYMALNSVKKLRTSMGDLHKLLSNGIRAEHAEGNEAKFAQEIQDHINRINRFYRDLEQATNNLVPPPGPFTLGNTASLCQESTQDKQALYKQLVQSFKWTDKVHEYSIVAGSLLSHNTLKRSYTNSSSAKRRRIQPSSHNVPPQAVDNVILNIDRLFPNMTMVIARPFASNAVLTVTLGRVLQAVIAFKGLMIEWVMIKGFGEQLDLWTESRHKVFRKVTENAHAAMLHFYSPTLPDLAVRSFMTWFHSYITLFSDPCRRCSNHLHNSLPPTWRDFRSLDPFHEECKQ